MAGKQRTVGAVFAAAVAADPARPLLTFYDDATDERTELSGATLGNWVAKTANMIVDDTSLGTGNRAAIGLPAHWQTAAVLLGCWTAGLSVTIGNAPSDIAFVAQADATHEWPAAERYALGLHPLALPMRTVPDGYLDFTAEVRSHGDHFYPAAPVEPGMPAIDDRSHEAVLTAATGRGEYLTGTAAPRVLIDAGAYPDPVDWLIAPLAAGASIVLCANLNTAKTDGRARTERVTHRLI